MYIHKHTFCVLVLRPSKKNKKKKKKKNTTTYTISNIIFKHLHFLCSYFFNFFFQCYIKYSDLLQFARNHDVKYSYLIRIITWFQVISSI